MHPLHTPLRLRGGALLPNRAALAPLTNQQSHADGTLGEDELRFLARRARGGFGLVETCAAAVDPDGRGFDGQLGMWGEDHLPGLTRLAGAIAAHGALPVAQLHHGGARSPSRITGVQPCSASAFAGSGPGFEPPRALSDAEVEAVLDRFVDAARRCARAGFAGVELHAAHGYLLCQFLSSVHNTRDDRWGGDPERRAALVRELARRVRAAVPAPFLLAVRLSPESMASAPGLDLDESLALAEGLAADGVDLVHLSLWQSRKDTEKRPGVHALPLFRAAVGPEVALSAAGRVATLADAEFLMERGADVVVVGRAAILDPDWARAVVATGYAPPAPPFTPEQFEAVDVGPAFVSYLRHFKLVA